MEKDSDKISDAKKLRKRAEEKHASRLDGSKAMDMSDSDTQKMIHELQTHQIELEMQNEELREAKLEIESLLERYTDLYDFAPVGYLTIDRNGSILQANLTAAKLLSMERFMLTGKRLGLFIIEAGRLAFSEFLKRVFESKDREIFQTELTTHDGSRMWVSITAFVPGGVEECRIVITDITLQRKSEDALQNAQKLESVGLLAGGIAHDFNNMLVGIFGYMEFAEDALNHKDIELAKSNLEKGLLVFDRAKFLTRQLLTFAKGGGPIKKVTELVPLIQNWAQFALSGSDVTCQCSIPLDLWPCSCDMNQIEQVIDNIVINARQAMLKGGTIEINAKNVELTPAQITPAHMKNNRRFIKISIKDYGTGIPKDILNRIYDPFFTTKTKGHGLGLSISYSVIMRHDGWIEVESAVGEGSTFHIFLPASQKNASVLSRDNPAEHKGRGTILLMDDEETVREIISSMLQEMHYKVVTAKNGKEAIGLFKDAEKSDTPFAACILDLTIPSGMGGKETALEIRKYKADALILAASGYADDPVIYHPEEYGFNGSIAKPFKAEELTKLMNKLSAIG